MKAFTVLVILFFLIFVIAASGVAQVDMTPDTPPAAVNQSVPVTGAGDDVIFIQEPTPYTDPKMGIPVTGTCTNPYIVQPGDILSFIAESCNTTLAAIRLANPEITNVNMIYPGQQIRIPVDGSQQTGQVQPLPAVQPTSLPPVAAPTADPALNNLQDNQPAGPAPTVTVPVPVTGLQPLVQPGTPLEVKAFDFPRNTTVNVAVGPQSAGYNIVSIGVTDAAGNLTTTVIAPNTTDPQAPYVVVVASTTTPAVQAMSQPFYIAGIQ